MGPWEQRTWGDIARSDPEQMENFGHRMNLWHVDGAETPEQVRDRTIHALKEIAAENEGKTVAVFSHGAAIRLALAYLQGYSMEELGKTPHGDNTAVSLLEAENGTLRVVYRDDNSHLLDPAMNGGECLHRKSTALEPGLWFAPLADQKAAAEQICREGGFDREQILKENHCALLGFLKEEPVGLLQLGEEPDTIEKLFVRESCRRRTFGTQALGQAVQYWRPRGSQRLRTVLDADSPAAAFFEHTGFVRNGTTETGRVIFEKDISFNPEFLAPEN